MSDKTVRVVAIAAMDRAGLIGNGGSLPWHLPRDLKRFREHTLGKSVIWGRRTFEALEGPLIGRRHIVLSQDRSFYVAGCRVAHSLGQALEIASEFIEVWGGDEVVIAGGGVVFEATVPLWDRLLLTVVDGEFQGDAYFPLACVGEYPWKLVTREFHAADVRNLYPHWFLDLERVVAVDYCSLGLDLGSWLDPKGT